MTQRVFVDTAAWIALINTSDALHGRALDVAGRLYRDRAQLLTTELVLLEVADALCAPRLRDRTVRFLDDLRRQNVVEIVPASDSLISDGWSLYRQRDDKGWGLTDCISFVVMGRNSLHEAFTSDQHFNQAGFITLISGP